MPFERSKDSLRPYREKGWAVDPEQGQLAGNGVSALDKVLAQFQKFQESQAKLGIDPQSITLQDFLASLRAGKLKG